MQLHSKEGKENLSPRENKLREPLNIFQIESLFEFVFFLSFLLGCSRSHCTKSIHLALNNTKNDVKHIDTTKSLMIGQCSSTGEAIKIPPIVTFGAVITLFKITVQSARFLLGTKSTVFCW